MRANISHIARHGITPPEAEQAITLYPIELEYENIDGEERVLLLGLTANARLIKGHYRVSGDTFTAAYLLQIGRIQDMTTKRTIPHFANEAEEAQWWFEHSDEFVEDFERSAADGTLGRGTVARRFGLQSNLVRLEPKDAATARELAMKRGVEYESTCRDSYIRPWSKN